VRAEPAHGAEAVVEVQNLAKHFGAFQAVAGVSFAVRRGSEVRTSSRAPGIICFTSSGVPTPRRRP